MSDLTLMGPFIFSPKYYQWPEKTESHYTRSKINWNIYLSNPTFSCSRWHPPFKKIYFNVQLIGLCCPLRRNYLLIQSVFQSFGTPIRFFKNMFMKVRILTTRSAWTCWLRCQGQFSWLKRGSSFQLFCVHRQYKKAELFLPAACGMVIGR